METVDLRTYHLGTAMKQLHLFSAHEVITHLQNKGLSNVTMKSSTRSFHVKTIFLPLQPGLMLQKNMTTHEVKKRPTAL